MKIILAAATAAALCAASGAAQAQAAPTGVYGSLGYADAHSDGVDLGVIQGRLGYRIIPTPGSRAEGAFGVRKDDVTVAGVTGRAKLEHEFAVYGVGFLPLSDKADLLARVGYGNTKVKVSALGTSARTTATAGTSASAASTTSTARTASASTTPARSSPRTTPATPTSIRSPIRGGSRRPTAPAAAGSPSLQAAAASESPPRPGRAFS